MTQKEESQVVSMTLLKSTFKPERAVHDKYPQNLSELKQRCKKESARIPPQQYERLIKSDRKWLL